MSKLDLPKATIIFRIPALYRPGMPPDELYEATRKSWRLNPVRARKAKQVLSVADGIVRAVYEPTLWVHTPDGDWPGRWAFVGEPSAAYAHLIGTDVSHLFAKGNANPVSYLNL